MNLISIFNIFDVNIFFRFVSLMSYYYINLIKLIINIALYNNIIINIKDILYKIHFFLKIFI